MKSFKTTVKFSAGNFNNEYKGQTTITSTDLTKHEHFMRVEKFKNDLAGSLLKQFNFSSITIK